MAKTTLRIAGICLMLGLIPATRGDNIYLNNGTMVEGRTAPDDDASAVELTTPSGKLLVPRSVIARIVPGPTRLELYEQEKSAQPLTTSRHLEIAQWCRDNGLIEKEREEIRRALEIDPTHVAALEAAGYVPLGDVWIKAQADADRFKPSENEQAYTDRVVRQLLQGWQLQVRAIRESWLRSASARKSGPATSAEGKARILKLSEPLALPAICKVLSDSNDHGRRVMVEALAASPLDVAILNLVALSVLDEDDDIRRTAGEAVATIPDPRIGSALRLILRSREDQLIRRAATMLGLSRDRQAVADLITALGIAPPPQDALDAMKTFDRVADMFDEPIRVAIGARGAQYPSAVYVPGLEQFRTRKGSPRRQREPAVRTEVQEALIAITGQNYGFDTELWNAWLFKNPPLPRLGQ